MSDLLTVKNLRTGFQTHGGLIRAVDGVDFSIPKGGTLGVVGESGSGKSVTALSIMKLVDAPGRVEASSNIIFDGQDLATLDEDAMAKIRGNDISMIFQEPMTSLNPVMTVGRQIAETVELHQKTSRREARVLQQLERHIVVRTPPRDGDAPERRPRRQKSDSPKRSTRS